MAELKALVRDDQPDSPRIESDADEFFSRIAVLGWCLLDVDVARVASVSGLLAAMVDGIQMPVQKVLTPEGLRLLRRRAPSAALSAGLLPPVVALRGVDGGGAVERITLARTPRWSRGVGSWAVSYEDKVWVGSGEHSERVMEGPSSKPKVLSLSRDGVLHVMDFAGAVIRRYRPSDGTLSDDAWQKGLWILASSEDAIVGADLGEQGVRAPGLAWGGISSAKGPSPLPPLEEGRVVDEVTRVTQLAVAGEHVAVVANERVWFGGLGRPWRVVIHSDDTLCTIAADETGVAYGTSEGEVASRAWEEPGASGVPEASSTPVSSRWTWAVALPGQEIVFSSRGGGRTVVASSSEMALVRGGAVEARWRPEAEGAYITAVALSPDGDTLAVAGSLMLRFWRLDAANEMRLTSFTADTPEGEDLLGVQPTVDALAALVAARAVEPPLSVGLFGPWGSGKSFFMRRVEKRVREITDESRSSERPQASMWAWRNIRHVRFNAWQYAAADVWAGLIEELVRELSRPAKGKDLELPMPAGLSALEKERINRLAGAATESDRAAEKLKEVRRVRDAAAKQIVAAQRELITAKKGVVDARNQAAKKIGEDDAVKYLDTALQCAGLPSVGTDLQGTWRELSEARRSAESVGAFLRGRRSMLLLPIVVAPLLGLAVALLLDRAGSTAPWLTGAITGLTTFLATATAWLRSRAQELQTRVAEIEAAAVAAGKVESAARAKQEKADRALHKAERKVELARLAAETAESEVTDAKAKVAAITPGTLLEEYLEGRQDSDDYRAMLGLIGTVRRDLDVISRGVVAHNHKLSENADANPDDVVNRVVLYVDDLDRCRPEVVVKVLESVSMLMSFPLFVVIVAVDSHWISRSLKHIYKEMLSDGQVTPDHYLEKIFQLPVWLDQPDAVAARTMTRSLLGVVAQKIETPAQERITRSGNSSPANASPAVSGDSATLGGGDSSRVTAPPPPFTFTPAGTIAESRNIALATTPPESVTLEPSETAAIVDLAPLLTRSPRALKRYLNTYRLLKAIVDPADLNLARMLLAIATGRPETGERLFQAMIPAGEATLADIIEGLPEIDREWLDLAPDHSWRQMPCCEAWPISQQVRRFVFRSEAGVTARDGDTG